MVLSVVAVAKLDVKGSERPVCTTMNLLVALSCRPRVVILDRESRTDMNAIVPSVGSSPDGARTTSSKLAINW